EDVEMSLVQVRDGEVRLAGPCGAADRQHDHEGGQEGPQPARLEQALPRPVRRSHGCDHSTRNEAGRSRGPAGASPPPGAPATGSRPLRTGPFYVGVRIGTAPGEVY